MPAVRTQPSTGLPEGGPWRLVRSLARFAAPPVLASAMVVLAAAGTVLVAMPPASAYVSAAGSGLGGAATATLASPGSVTATATVGSGTVPVSWSVATLSTGQAVSGYYVLRVRTSDQLAFAACGSSATTLVITTSCSDVTVPDGTYRYQVVAVVGSWTAASALGNSVTVVNNASLPTAAVTGAAPATNINGWNNTSPVTVTVTGAPGALGTPVASVTTWVDSGTHTTAPGTTATVSVTGNGVHTVSFYATDTAARQGTTGTYTVRIDTIGPAAPSAPKVTAATDTGASATDDITKNTSPALTGTAEAGATVTLYDGTTLIGTGTATAGGAYTIATGTLAAGTHTLTAKATDLAGNVSPASTATSVVVDTTAPAAPSAPALTAASDSGRSSTDKITNVTTPTFTGTAETGATVTLYEAGSAVGTGTAPAGSWSVTTSSLADGSRAITATATDLAGNISVASGATTITIDTLAPSPPSKPALATSSDTGISNNDGTTKDTTPTFSGTTEKKSTVTLYDGATSVAVSGSVNSGNYSLTTSALNSATHSITATTTDVAGNTSAASTATTVVVDTVTPTVTLNQAAGQADPALTTPVAFTGLFSETVYGLTNTDLTLTGTARATTTAISGTGPTYTISVSGMARHGTVTATIPASTVTDAAGNNNTASTSTDNNITYNGP